MRRTDRGRAVVDETGGATCGHKVATSEGGDMARRSVWKTAKTSVAFTGAALFGALAAVSIVRYCYNLEVARVRRVLPHAWVCDYDYLQMATWMAPLGACVAVTLWEVFRSIRHRRDVVRRRRVDE
jgi:hypothetical protein